MSVVVVTSYETSVSQQDDDDDGSVSTVIDGSPGSWVGEWVE